MNACLYVVFTVVASLRGENASELSPGHSNTLRNMSSIVVAVKSPTTNKSTTATSPTTTTTLPPSTTVPTLPDQHRWNVTDGGNVCLLLESGIRMTFNYVRQVRVWWHFQMSLLRPNVTLQKDCIICMCQETISHCCP